MSAGEVYLTKGRYLTKGSILLNKNGVILKGAGWDYDPFTGAKSGTVIEVQDVVTNSLNVSGYHCRIQDILINGNSKAVQAYCSVGYTCFSHFASVGHSSFNLYVCGNDNLITNRCLFLGKRVKVDNVVTIDGLSYFNGNGADICLEVLLGTAINIENCAFESYLTNAILFSSNGNYYGVTIKGNYFESAAVVANAICAYSASQSVGGAVIEGNYEAANVNTTNFINIYGARGVSIKGNFSGHPIVIGAGTYDCDIMCSHNEAGVTYNTLTGLKSLKVVDRVSEFFGAAIPVAGTWPLGCKIRYTAPAAGGAPGAIVTTPGTPGTWKEEAALAA